MKTWLKSGRNPYFEEINYQKVINRHQNENLNKNLVFVFVLSEYFRHSRQLLEYIELNCITKENFS